MTLTAGTVPVLLAAAPAQAVLDTGHGASVADHTPPLIRMSAVATASGVTVMYAFGTLTEPDTDVMAAPIVRGTYGTTAVASETAGFGIPIRTPGVAAVNGLTPGQAVTVTVFAEDTSDNVASKSLTIRGSSATVAPSAAVVNYGTAVSLTSQAYGIFTAPQSLPNQVVAFERRPRGTTTWLPIQLSVSDAAGRALAPGFVPTATTEVRIRVVGNDKFVSGLSAPRTITVRPTVSLALSKKSVKKNKSVKLTGKVAQPGGARGVVQLQRWTKGAWRPVASKKVSAANAFSFTVKQKAKGKVRYRAFKVSDGARTAAASPVRTVNVK